MQQYEGQRVKRTLPDGTVQRGIVRNGRVEPLDVAPLPRVIQGPPKEPAPQTPTQAAIDEERLDRLRNPEPTLPTGYRMGPSGVAERIPGLEAENDLSPEKRAEITGRRTAVGAFRSRIDEIESLYQSTFAGDKGALLGMGGDRNLAGYLPNVVRPENKAFDDAANSLIGAIMSMQGTTGGEANSLAELKARFGPMLPNSTDSDENIRLKLARLRQMADDEEGKLSAQLGQAALPPPPAETPDGRHIYEGGSQQGVELSDGGARIQDDPKLAGVNGQVNAMLKAGRPIGEVAKYLEGIGIPLQGEIGSQLAKIEQWRRANPGYKGDYTVNLDDVAVPASGFSSALADAANSDLGAYAAAAGQVLTGNHLDNLVEATGGNGELANVGMGLLREQNPYASLAGDVTGGAALYGVGRGVMAIAGRSAPPATNALAGRAVAGDAAMGGYIASGSDGTNAFSGTNALLGAGLGAGAGIVGRGAINTTARAISPSGGSLAPAYAEGVKPTIGQRMGGVFDRAEQAFASVPLVGGIQRSARNNAVQQWQAGAFNKALREVGARLPKGIQSGTQAHAFMQRTFNQAYDKARSGLTFRQDDQFNAEFRELVNNEVASLGSDGQRIFKGFVDRGANMLRARGGTLAGQDYKNLVSRIEAKIRGLRKSPSGDTELADALEGLSLALDKAARRHSDPEAVKALDAADRGYVMAVLIEEAGRKAGTEMGEFTGKQLESAIRSNSGRRSRQALRGEAPLQDYAAAGVRLGNSVPDSGTPERLMTMGGMAGMAHFVDPALLSPWAANTLANLPGGKQVISALASPNRRALDPARRKLMERAHLGGILAAPAANSVGK